MNYELSVVPCAGYDSDEAERALRAVLEPIGGLDFVEPGMRVAVKLNLVAAMRPETAATVHPALICALTKLLRERGAHVVLGDSPGGLFNAAALHRVYEVCGVRAARELGAELNEDFSQIEAEFPEGKLARSFPYTGWLQKADAIIDFCKLKSHGMMGMTCAVKNFFGSVPGTRKPEYHYRYPKAEDFAQVLVDLCEYSAPRLCICDAVVGMEGNGPTQGTPRQIGCLLASPSAHALDLAAAELIGLKPEQVPTLKAAMDRGLVPRELGELTIHGELEPFRQPDFQTVPAQSSVLFLRFGSGRLGRAADAVAGRILTPFPKLDGDACIGCGKCAATCPAKAITMVKKRPRIDRKRCIHCFCCQEFCPRGAMRPARHWIARMLGR